MKTFSQWRIDEAVGSKLGIKLTVAEAEKVLGLSGSYTPEDVTKAVKRAKMKAHPDRGGSVDEFNRVQAAEATLAGRSGATTRQDARAETEAKYQAAYLQIMSELRDMFKAENFVKYFEGLFKEPFDSKVTPNGATGRGTPHYAGYTAEFFNKDRSKVFELQFSVYLTNVVWDTTKSIGGGADTLSYSMGVTAYGYANKRKVKMSQRDYKSSNNRKVLQDPKVAFPQSKVMKDQKKRKFSKRDMELFIRKELDAVVTTQSMYVRLKDAPHVLMLDRGTFMRTPYWQVAIWEEFGKTGGNFKPGKTRMYVTFPETEETADMLKTASKMTAAQAEKFLKQQYEAMKA